MGVFNRSHPRAELLREDLTRPSWTEGLNRNSRLLWLDKNENLDPELQEFTRKLLSRLDPLALCTYPESAPLYHQLGKWLDMPAEHLILTHGSDGAIRSTFEAFINPGDRVLHTAPTFAMYPVYSKIFGAQVRTLEYEPTESGPKLHVQKILDVLTEFKPKLFCLPNPDSPTGTVFNPDEMRKIIEGAGKVGALVLIDEAYHPFYEPSVISWVKEYDHLIVARTFAKAWGLAGVRIGYAAASKEAVRFMHKIRPMYEVGAFAVEFMKLMLEHPGEMKKSVQRLNRGKEVFQSEMKKLGLKTYPSHGNFMHVAFGPHQAAVFQKLDQLVLYRKDFAEACLKGFSRFSATTETQFRPIIEAIRSVVA